MKIKKPKQQRIAELCCSIFFTSVTVGVFYFIFWLLFNKVEYWWSFPTLMLLVLLNVGLGFISIAAWSMTIEEDYE